MSKPGKKLFIVRKYIMASSIAEAIRLDKKTKPEEVWIDDDWKKANTPEPSKPIGFAKK